LKYIKKNKSLADEIISSKYTIKYDKFDLRNFKEITEANPKLKSIYEEGIDIYPPFEELHQDVFDSLYKYSPQKFSDSQIDYEYLLNSKVMDAVIQSPKYKELRLLTRLDIVNATMGTQVVGEKVKDLVKQLSDNVKDAIANAKKAEKAIKGHEKNDDASEEEVEASNQLTLEEAKKLLEESITDIEDSVSEKEEYKIQNILGKAVLETQETSKIIQNWGLEKDPHYTKTGYQEKIKLLEKLKNSKKLKQLAEIAGRYKRWAIAQYKSKTKYGVDSLRGITRGADIGKLIPTESMKLQHPILKKVFKKDLLEGNLLQYNYNHREKESAGPIICCVDSSGSMYGPAEIWAKAVALGLLEIAKRQKRSFCVVHFSSNYREDHLHVNYFPKTDPYSVNKILDMAEYFEGGGTAFEPPLSAARTYIDKEKEFSKADIIFITDGYSAVRNSWLSNFNKWKISKNIKVYSVVIDCVGHTDIALNEFSDEVIHLSKLNQTYFDKTASVLFKVV
jgi:uncharacterized protein with von Willebrand factor type A (vWA) domain